ncbi:MAG: response regulator [Sedimentisphaerales bacterium]|nr:response regulator [Sedimentisphaerales bacterium]
MSENKLDGEPLIILLVEDNPGHAELVIRNLNKHRVLNNIHHVLDGEQCLDYLFHKNEYSAPEKSPRPHLILLDLRLPKIDGLDVLKTIKTTDNLYKIPTVILSTSEAEQDVAQAYEYRANSYLVKPIDFEKFNNLMKDLGYYWLGWNTRPWA